MKTGAEEAKDTGLETVYGNGITVFGKQALPPAEETGLSIIGTVQGRRRRAFEKKGGGNRYNISLAILTQDGLIVCEQWADIPLPAGTPKIGDTINARVQMQHYHGKSGSGVRLIYGGAQSAESF